jgi:hypothetical protein
MRSLACVVLVSLAAALPAAAASGTVVDSDGNPVAQARACLFAEADTGFCVETDERGYYRLPTTSVDTVRITAEGFLSQFVAAVPQSSPVVLRRAAAILVHVVDAGDGSPLSGGTVAITYFSGRTIDGHPFNRSGVKVSTLEPGSALVRASLAGYRDSDGLPVVLTAGERAEVTLRLRRAP